MDDKGWYVIRIEWMMVQLGGRKRGGHEWPDKPKTPAAGCCRWHSRGVAHPAGTVPQASPAEFSGRNPCFRTQVSRWIICSCGPMAAASCQLAAAMWIQGTGLHNLACAGQHLRFCSPGTHRLFLSRASWTQGHCQRLGVGIAFRNAWRCVSWPRLQSAHSAASFARTIGRSSQK